jgi:hypothetical protein
MPGKHKIINCSYCKWVGRSDNFKVHVRRHAVPAVPKVPEEVPKVPEEVPKVPEEVPKVPEEDEDIPQIKVVRKILCKK